MTINEFLQKYRREEFGLNVTRPRVRCADGFTVSVQAGYGLYSTPNRDANAYTHVELGYPSCKEEALMEYAESKRWATETVYGNVPVELVDEVIKAHGGIAGADFSNVKSEAWEGYDAKLDD